MTRQTWRRFAAAIAVSISCIGAAAQTALAVAPQVPQAEAERFREELAVFFDKAAEFSPTALGAVAKNPEAMQRIRERIGKLAPEELKAMHAVFSQVPAWQVVPEALKSSLPAGALQQMDALSEQVANQAREIEGFRDEVSEMYAALQLLPPGTLDQLGHDPASVALAQRNLQALPRQGLAIVREQMAQHGDWKSVKSELLGSLSPRMRQRAQLLVQKGALGEQDVQELSAFRIELEAFFGSVRQLPPELRQRLNLASIAKLEQRLGTASPEILFVLREEIDSPALRQAMRDVKLLAGASKLALEEVALLQAFRREMISLFAELHQGTQGVAAWEERVHALSDAELLLLRDRIQQIPGWNKTLPVIFKVAATPAIAGQVQALRQGTLAAEERAALEKFREQMTVYYENLGGTAGIDATASRRTAEHLRRADLTTILLMQGAYAQVHSTWSSSQMLQLGEAITVIGPPPVGPAIDLNCTIGLGSISLPLGIGTVSLGSVNVDFICNPIETVINTLESAVDAVEAVIDDVFNAVVSLPDTIKDFFAGLAQSALDNFNPENLQSTLGLTGDFWNDIPQVPQIPCPPDGFDIPFFGEVGEEETAAKYSRYLWVFDKVLEIIPDTEVSLTIKIPAQVLYAGVEYLGICLDAAAATRADAETKAFRAGVNNQFNSLDQGVGTVQASLNALASQVNAQGATLSGQIDVQGGELLSQLNLQGAQLASQIDTQGEELGEQFDQLGMLTLRLAIEEDLLHEVAGNQQVSLFQMPESLGGHLELVETIVKDTIDMNEAAGENVSTARSNYGSGQTLYQAGDYKQAYYWFRRAYQAAVRR